MNDPFYNVPAVPQRKSVIARALDGLGEWVGNTRPVRLLLSSSEGWGALSSFRNFTGQRASVNSALQISTVWACVRLVSEVISTLPCNVYKRGSSGAKVDQDHPLHDLIHASPNFEQTACVFWQTFLASMMLRDGAYVEVRYAAGAPEEPSSLFNLMPDCLSDPDAEGWCTYSDPETGMARRIRRSNIWYTPAFTLNGKTGITPIAAGANVFGGAMAADRASADTFTNGMRASGIVTMDAVLKPEQREMVRQHVAQVTRQGGVFVLEKSTGFQQLNMTPQDAQLLSTRHFNVEEICRWFRVPPFMVGHNDKASGYPASLEAQMTMFVTMVLRPYLVRIEQSINKFLLTRTERRKWHAEFVVEGLLRGDSAARSAFYNAGVNNGWMTRDEVRAKENLPLQGGNAEVLTVQQQMVPLDKAGTFAAPAPGAAPAGDPAATPPTAPPDESTAKALRSLKSLGDLLSAKEHE
jgi:HK97 family phage portal protein